VYNAEMIKTLTILLTLLLSFSFADAMSVKFQIITDKFSETGGVRIIYPKKRTSDSESTYKHFIVDMEFKNGAFIDSVINRNAFRKLINFQEDILGLKLGSSDKFTPMTYTASNIYLLFQDVLIGNGYMITETKEDVQTSYMKFHIFAYKPSK
jgi:hypothetical protein